MIDVKPAVLVSPLDEQDVQQAIRIAVEQDMRLSVKGGGHNVAGHALVENGLVIDLSEMRGVRVDPQRRRVYVQGGALWSDVDTATARYGLATPGGVISHTGVAGLTLGGGIGWLMGKHGMVIDNLISARVVTANGDVVVASEDSHPDLFWALRGGGGNFGVVTEFEFALHEQGDIFGGLLIYPIEQASEVLAVYQRFTETAPDQLGLYAEPSTDPESGQRVFVLAFFWPGEIEEGKALLESLKAAIPPAVDGVQVMPYTDIQQAFDPVFAHGVRYYWKGVLLESLAPEVLDAVDRLGSHPPFPGCTAVIEWYRGPMNRVDSAATAFANRNAQFQVVIIGAWDRPEDDQEGIEWARSVYRAIAPYGLGQGFLNFNSVEADNARDMVHRSYGANYDRLVEVKRAYDPDNVFRGNHNILPA
ncbi:MAG: FAD-binding oxidoreductase, partial [Thermomicrobiales bacterium]